MTENLKNFANFFKTKQGPSLVGPIKHRTPHPNISRLPQLLLLTFAQAANEDELWRARWSPSWCSHSCSSPPSPSPWYARCATFCIPHYSCTDKALPTTNRTIHSFAPLSLQVRGSGGRTAVAAPAAVVGAQVVAAT